MEEIEGERPTYSDGYKVGEDYKAVDGQRVCLWASELTIPDALLSVLDGNDGFHVFRHLSDCAEKCRWNDNRILKVKVWGAILHYPGSDSLDHFADMQSEGYRAAHMTIVSKLPHTELISAWEKNNKKENEKRKECLVHD